MASDALWRNFQFTPALISKITRESVNIRNYNDGGSCFRDKSAHNSRRINVAEHIEFLEHGVDGGRRWGGREVHPRAFILVRLLCNIIDTGLFCVCVCVWFVYTTRRPAVRVYAGGTESRVDWLLEYNGR